MTMESTPVGITAPRYDRGEQLAHVRARRAAVSSGAHAATVQIGGSVAAIMAEELPYDPEVIGDVLLCAGTKLAGMLVDGLLFPSAINILAFAASDLIGEGEVPPQPADCHCAAVADGDVERCERHPEGAPR